MGSSRTYASFSKDFNYIISRTKHVQFVGLDYDSVYSYVHEHTVLGIKTLEANKSKFSKQDVIRAEAARKLQHVAGHPSYVWKKFLKLFGVQIRTHFTSWKFGPYL